MTIPKHVTDRLILEMEIIALEKQAVLLPRRSPYRTLILSQLKAAKLARMMLDLNWDERKAA